MSSKRVPKYSALNFFTLIIFSASWGTCGKYSVRVCLLPFLTWDTVSANPKSTSLYRLPEVLWPPCLLSVGSVCTGTCSNQFAIQAMMWWLLTHLLESPLQSTKLPSGWQHILPLVSLGGNAIKSLKQILSMFFGPVCQIENLNLKIGPGHKPSNFNRISALVPSQSASLPDVGFQVVLEHLWPFWQGYGCVAGQR